MRLRFAFFAIAAALGAGAGIGVAAYLARGSSPPVQPSRPAATWAAGARAAPDFRLADQRGRPVSLASLRGRPTIVTFIDPLCRDLCPLEAQVLTRVQHELGRRAPALVAVSVNPPGDTRANLARDAQEWRLPPSWHWALGSPSALAHVWRNYKVGVRLTLKTIAGVKVREVAHIEAAYVIDGAGDQRALFIYPFVAADVERELESLGP